LQVSTEPTLFVLGISTIRQLTGFYVSFSQFSIKIPNLSSYPPVKLLARNGKQFFDHLAEDNEQIAIALQLEVKAINTK